jgi:hypothetical protein
LRSLAFASQAAFCFLASSRKSIHAWGPPFWRSFGANLRPQAFLRNQQAVNSFQIEENCLLVSVMERSPRSVSQRRSLFHRFHHESIKPMVAFFVYLAGGFVHEIAY